MEGTDSAYIPALRTTDFNYDLPVELIAQTPLEPRDASRLLVLDRESGAIQHAIFRHLGQYLESGDLLVLNETRVLPARFHARKAHSAGRVEILLLRRKDERTWEALVGGKGMVDGKLIELEAGPRGEIVEVLTGARRLIRFLEPLEPYIERIGQVPLPPYIQTPLQDPERYQTVYSNHPGSVAAPTAGLHFTRRLINQLKRQGIRFAKVTLHVGLDTFGPVTEDDPRQHAIHTEWCQVSAQAAQAINQTRRRGKRIVAVGTTSVRALESAASIASHGQVVAPFEGATDLFILPGHAFRAVDAMLTNFHLPRSTLIMLVSAYAGRERILAAYQTAIQQGYRFYSFGDAMLII